MNDTVENVRLEQLLPAPVLDNTTLAVLAKAEIDQQIATAHAFPRDIRRVKNDILSLVTLDDETAIECIYALTRGGKPIRGPSIRFAEVLFSQWGNCRSGAQVVAIDRTNMKLTAEGFFHDLQSNAAIKGSVERRISDKYGKLYSEDMITVTGNAACSIALRNAILHGIPKAVWREAYQRAEQVIAGDAKTLMQRRDAALKAFAAFGVNAERICKALDVPSMEAVTLDHLVTLTGMHNALKTGEGTVEVMFPVEVPKVPSAPPKGAPVARVQEQAPAAADPAKTNDEAKAYIGQLEDSLIVANKDPALIIEVIEDHKPIHPTLPKAYQEQADALFVKYNKEAAQAALNGAKSTGKQTAQKQKDMGL
jgi:hypothetical protein